MIQVVVAAHGIEIVFAAVFCPCLIELETSVKVEAALAVEILISDKGFCGKTIRQPVVAFFIVAQHLGCIIVFIFDADVVLQQSTPQLKNNA